LRHTALSPVNLLNHGGRFKNAQAPPQSKNSAL
jgi:hypothetical protein